MKIMNLAKRIAMPAAALLLAACSSFNADPEATAFVRQMEDAIISPEQAKTIKTAAVSYNVVALDGRRGTISVKFKAPYQYRCDIISDDGAEVICLNDNKGWYYNPKDGVCDLTDQEVREALAEVFLLPLNREFSRLAEKARFAGTETVNGELCRIIEIKTDDRDIGELKIWAGEKSKCLRKLLSIYKGDVYETTFFRHRRFDGIMLASETFENRKEGMIHSTLANAVWNIDIPDSEFLPPKKLK